LILNTLLPFLSAFFIDLGGKIGQNWQILQKCGRCYGQRNVQICIWSLSRFIKIRY